MPITEVVIDRKLLTACELRLCKAYPKESAEQLWGKVCRHRASIHYIEPIDIIESDRESVDFNFDQNIGTSHTGLKLLGSCHSHPNDNPIPSDADIVTANDDKEKIFGICSIRKRRGRKFFEWGFYDRLGNKLVLILSD